LSGALPTSSTGITAKAPPPEEFQLTEMYLPFALNIVRNRDYASSDLIYSL